MLKAKNLSKIINGKEILKNINFEIEYGQMGIFLGESGAGKSSLLRLINRLEKYDTGTLTLDGKSLGPKREKHQHQIGMVFQNYNLFEHLNVEANLLIALHHSQQMSKSEARKIAFSLLERFGLQKYSRASVATLSGGQKQRLALARTLALDPKVICFDEPTSALDPALTIQVAQLITSLIKENKIVLLTTHDLNLLDHLEGELFFMEKATIAEKVSKEDLSACQNVYPGLTRFFSPLSPK
ncbi:MAG: Glutamine transport ATP-binding protein GlnQ [Chlamydiales bacterium]|nr:Glutamine transport ATP-binding protein GlnQ [Chlamydiales bacterium]